MENQKVYHLTMIYKPKYVIKDVHGRHSNNNEEYKIEVGVLDNFDTLVSVCSKIDHTNAYIPPNLSGRFGFWGTSFDKRDPIQRDFIKMVSGEEALNIMLNGPTKYTNDQDDEYDDMDFYETEKRQMEILKREIENEEYEEYLNNLENRFN